MRPARPAHRDTVAEHLVDVLGASKGKYELAGNEKLPREVEHDLEMWGCVACNFCVTVCPNDAFFKLPTPKADADPDGIFADTSPAVSSTSCLANCATSVATA